MSDTIADLVVNLRADFSDLTPALDKAEGQVGKFVDTTEGLADKLRGMVTEEVTRAIDSLAERLGAARGAAEGFDQSLGSGSGVEKFGGAIEKVVAAADEIGGALGRTGDAAREADESLGAVDGEKVAEGMRSGAEGAQELTEGLEEASAAGKGIGESIGSDALKAGTEALGEATKATGDLAGAIEDLGSGASGDALKDEAAAAEALGQKMEGATGSAEGLVAAIDPEALSAGASAVEGVGKAAEGVGAGFEKSGEEARSSFDGVADAGTSAIGEIVSAWTEGEARRKDATVQAGEAIAASEDQVVGAIKDATAAVGESATAVTSAFAGVKDSSEAASGAVEDVKDHVKEFEAVVGELSPRMREMLGDQVPRQLEAIGAGAERAKVGVEEFFAAFENDVVDRFGADAETAAQKQDRLAEAARASAEEARKFDEALDEVAASGAPDALEKTAQASEKASDGLKGVAEAAKNVQEATSAENLGGGADALGAVGDAAEKVGTALEQAAAQAKAHYEEVKAAATSSAQQILEAWIEMEDKRLAVVVSAGEKVSEAEARALDAAKAALAEMTGQLPQIEAAFSTLGVKSAASLREFADVAEKAYEAIKSSAESTAQDVEKAWVAMERARMEAARAAGDEISAEEKETLAAHEAAIAAVEREGAAIRKQAGDWQYALDNATKFGAEVDEAFRTLGVESSAQLQKTADEAEAAFQKITSSAVASDHDRLASWVAMEEARQEAARSSGEIISEREREELERAKEQLRGAGDAAREGAGGLQEFAEKLIAIGEALVIVESLRRFGEAALEEAEAGQRMTNSLTALTGSMEQAKRTMEEVEEISHRKPFAQPEIEEAARKLTIYHVEASKLPGILETISDDARATGKSFGTIASSLEMIMARGSVAPRQLKALGISFEDIAAAAGKSVAEIQKLMQKGGQDAIENLDLVINAIRTKFAGMRDIPLTLGEMWQTVKTQMSDVMEEVGKAIAPVLAKIVALLHDQLLPAVRAMVDDFRKLPDVVQSGVVVMGLLVTGAVGLAASLGALGLAVAGLKTGWKLLVDAMVEYNLVARTAAVTSAATNAAMGASGLAGGAGAASKSVFTLGSAFAAIIPIAVTVGGAIAAIKLTDTDKAFASFASSAKRAFDTLKTDGPAVIDSLGRELKSLATSAIDSAGSFVGLEDVSDDLKIKINDLGFDVREFGRAFKKAWEDNAGFGGMMFPQFMEVKRGFEEARKGADYFSEGMDVLAVRSREADEMVSKSVGDFVAKTHELTKAGEDMKNALAMSEVQARFNDAGKAVRDFAMKQLEAKKELEEAEKVYNKVSDALKNHQGMLNGVKLANNALVTAEDAVLAAKKKVNPLFDASNVTMERSIKSAAELADKQSALNATVDKARAVYQSLLAHQDGTEKSARLLATAYEQFKKAFDAAAGSMKTGIPTLEDLNMKQALLARAVMDAESQLKRAEEQYRKTGQGARELAIAQQNYVDAQKAALGASKDSESQLSLLILKQNELKTAAVVAVDVYLKAYRQLGANSDVTRAAMDEAKKAMESAGMKMSDLARATGQFATETVAVGKGVVTNVYNPVSEVTGKWVEVSKAAQNYGAEIGKLGAAAGTALTAPIDGARAAWDGLSATSEGYAATVRASSTSLMGPMTAPIQAATEAWARAGQAVSKYGVWVDGVKPAAEGVARSVQPVVEIWGNAAKSTAAYAAAARQAAIVSGAELAKPVQDLVTAWEQANGLPIVYKKAVEQAETQKAIGAMVEGVTQLTLGWTGLSGLPPAYAKAVGDAAAASSAPLLNPIVEAQGEWGKLTAKPPAYASRVREATADEDRLVDELSDAQRTWVSLTEAASGYGVEVGSLVDVEQAVADALDPIGTEWDQLNEGVEKYSTSVKTAAEKAVENMTAPLKAAVEAWKPVEEEVKNYSVKITDAKGTTELLIPTTRNVGEVWLDNAKDVGVYAGKVDEAFRALGNHIEQAGAKSAQAANQAKSSISAVTYTVDQLGHQVTVYTGHVGEGYDAWGFQLDAVKGVDGAVQGLTSDVGKTVDEINRATSAAENLGGALSRHGRGGGGGGYGGGDGSILDGSYYHDVASGTRPSDSYFANQPGFTVGSFDLYTPEQGGWVFDQSQMSLNYFPPAPQGPDLPQPGKLVKKGGKNVWLCTSTFDYYDPQTGEKLGNWYDGYDWSGSAAPVGSAGAEIGTGIWGGLTGGGSMPTAPGGAGAGDLTDAIDDATGSLVDAINGSGSGTTDAVDGLGEALSGTSGAIADASEDTGKWLAQQTAAFLAGLDDSVKQYVHADVANTNQVVGAIDKVVASQGLTAAAIEGMTGTVETFVGTVVDGLDEVTASFVNSNDEIAKMIFEGMMRNGAGGAPGGLGGMTEFEWPTGGEGDQGGSPSLPPDNYGFSPYPYPTAEDAAWNYDAMFGATDRARDAVRLGPDVGMGEPVERTTLNFNAPITFRSPADYDPFVKMIHDKM